MAYSHNKRDRILQAGVQVFARKGFHNSRVSEIARHAGVADGTIYLYFKNKVEILISIFEEEMEKIINEVQIAVSSQTTSESRLKAFIQTHLEIVRKKPKLAQVFHLELRQSNRFLKEYSGTKLREYLTILSGLFEAGQAEGAFSAAIPANIFKRALFGALDEVATHWVLSKNKKYDPVASAEQIANIFLYGARISPKHK